MAQHTDHIGDINEKVFMKKYNVFGQVGSKSYDVVIECDYFSYEGNSGVYYFHNSETGTEWWFPVMHTIIKKIINK